jgi:DNA-binding GntR family transcriptional regulator
MNSPAHQTRTNLDRTRQAAPQVAESLRDKILSLELEPGAVLSRIGLQEQFGLSQTPIRDALMTLQEQGLVTIFPQYATIVSRIDINLAKQGHFLRRSVEQEAARELALRPRVETVSRLRAANEQVRKFALETTYDSFVLADRDFHHTIFAEADILDLWPLLRRHSGHMDRLRRLNLPVAGKLETIISQHETIIDCIEAGNPDAALGAMRIHLSGTLAMIDEIVARYPQYIEPTASTSI